MFSAVLQGDILKKLLLDLGLEHLIRFTKDVKKDYLSLPQLSPTKQYQEKFPMGYLVYLDHYIYFEVDYEGYLNFCKGIFGESNANYGKIFQEQIRGSGGYNILLEHPNAYFLVGRGMPTVEKVVFYDYPYPNLVDAWATDLTYINKGDGIVPYQSATMMEHVESGRQCEFAATHEGLAGHRANENPAAVNAEASRALETIVGILSDSGQSPRRSGRNETVPDKKMATIRVTSSVDATITKDGEKLTSTSLAFSNWTSFGRMDIIGQEGEIKMFHVDDGVLPVELKATDAGTMNYAIHFFDENNNLTGERTFEDVSITASTIITTETNREGPTVLNVDEGGDGVVDYTISSDSGGGDEPGGGGGGGVCNAGLGAGALILATGLLVGLTKGKRR